MFHHAPVLVLVLGIGIGIGQYYWVLGIGCLVWYCSNPNCESSPGSRDGCRAAPGGCLPLDQAKLSVFDRVLNFCVTHRQMLKCY